MIGTIFRRNGILQHVRGKSSKSSSEWLSRQSRDPFVKQRNEASGGYRARSAFKLMELDDRFKFLSTAHNGEGLVVVDLGGAPGGWSQVVARRLNHTDSTLSNASSDPLSNNVEVRESKVVDQDTRGTCPSTIIAVDLLPIKPIPGVHVIQGDFLSTSTRDNIAKFIPSHKKRVDVVLSDMAPNISGNRFRDIDLSLELCSSAFQFAQEWLISTKETGNRRSGSLM
ncbi:2' O-ribose methyltransferase [Tulasnella sp. 418]|nr:2' O-ribose methyltransferase [Tulasnella sp. 418]